LPQDLIFQRYMYNTPNPAGGDHSAFQASWLDFRVLLLIGGREGEESGREGGGKEKGGKKSGGKGKGKVSNPSIHIFVYATDVMS